MPAIMFICSAHKRLWTCKVIKWTMLALVSLVALTTHTMGVPLQSYPAQACTL